MNEKTWYTQTRETRVTERGRAQTSRFVAMRRAERTLRTRKVTPQEVQEIKERDNVLDDHRQDAYQPVILNGRICN